MAWIIQDIEQKYLDQLAKYVPQMPVALFKCAVSNYLAPPEERDPLPSKVRDELDKVVIAASELSQMLSDLSFPGTDALDDEARRIAPDGLRLRLKGDLDALFWAAEMARRGAEAKVGTKPPSRTTGLVADLARGLRIGGADVDAKPQGPLVLAFGIALEFLRTRASDPEKIKGDKDMPGTVAAALKTLGKY
jgi:hypothetical protein